MKICHCCQQPATDDDATCRNCGEASWLLVDAAPEEPTIDAKDIDAAPAPSKRQGRR